jgi:hypothetical protein
VERDDRAVVGSRGAADAPAAPGDAEDLDDGQLSRNGIVERREDDDDRRRRIISIDPDRREAIRAWLGRGAAAWRHALDPLTPAQRQAVVDTLRRYDDFTEAPDN